jgi:hypothetical protein
MRQVDGKQAPVVAADLALAGVFIPPGTHDVRLYLNPLSFRVGTMLTVIAIICTVGLLAGGLIPRYELPLLQPLAFGTGVAAVAAIAIIVSANPDLSASDRAADDVPRRQSVTLQFSNEVGIVTVPTPKLQTGYAQFKTDSLGTTGMALLQYEQGKVESEIAMSSNTPITDGSIPFRLSGQFRTAMILVNTASNEVHIDLSADSDPRQRSITIPAKDKLTVNLDEPPLSIGSSVGTLTWKSTGPLAVSAVETFTDATHPFLMAPIPVSTAAGLKKESVFIPFWNGFRWRGRTSSGEPDR